MTTKLRNALRVAAFACGIALLSGCANTDALEQEMNTAIAAAQTAAEAAQSAANEARQLAIAAQNTADEALEDAQEAQAGVEATNQRLDRMAEEGVLK